MRILLVKTSSLGDVIHNLPVVADILTHYPEATIDWCVEESFADIPRLHPAVGTIHRVALRRWRKAPLSQVTRREFRAFRQALQAHSYDIVVDTQGLLKSALLARLARGLRCGYARDSAREPIASFLYQRTFSVPRNQHAVRRNRALAAAALDYPLPPRLDYGLAPTPLVAPWLPPAPYAVLLTATSRDDKLWPPAHWTALGRLLADRGISAVLPAGSPQERERAAAIASTIPGAVVAPAMRIADLAGLLAGARGCIGVDTGLTHLAAALGLPTLAIYTATDPGLTGVLGEGPHANQGGRGQTPTPDAIAAGFLALLP